MIQSKTQLKSDQNLKFGGGLSKLKEKATLTVAFINFNFPLYLKSLCLKSF